jgi:hypothetical protein
MKDPGIYNMLSSASLEVVLVYYYWVHFVVYYVAPDAHFFLGSVLNCIFGGDLNIPDLRAAVLA